MSVLRPLSLRFNIFRTTASLLQVRNSSYHDSEYLVDVGESKVKYEINSNPQEWKFVERILPVALVPEPTKKAEYRSGWKPQGENLQDRPYFIARTKNHMIPVYLRIIRNNTTRHTYIRKIQGDIWQLEKDLRPFLEDLIKPKPVRLQVDELGSKIIINGDHVNAIKYWLEERNL